MKLAFVSLASLPVSKNHHRSRATPRCSAMSAAPSSNTGPYQLDGRITNLREQALAAITAHSQGGTIANAQLDDQRDRESNGA